jgi:broad specificity phosphatase PhoE
MTRLIFVRHCETINNVKSIISSNAPGPGLTDVGWQQARQLAVTMADVVLDGVYTSPLLRARQTAASITTRSRMAPIIRGELRECGVGDLEGRSDQLAFARYHEVWDQWFHHTALDLPLGPNGENGNEALARLRSVVQDVSTEHPGGTVALVSHGAILHFGLALMSRNLVACRPHEWPLPNAGTIIAESDGNDLTCVDWCGQVGQPNPHEPLG